MIKLIILVIILISLVLEGFLMNNIHSIRFIGGLAAIGSGALLFAAHLLEEVGHGQFIEVIAKNMVMIAHLGMIFGFISIHESSSRMRTFGHIGMFLATVGTALVSLIVFVEISAAAGAEVREVVQADGVGWVHTFGPLIFVAGILLVGIRSLIAGDSSRLGGSFLILGTIVFAAAGSAGAAEPILIVAGAAITGGGLIRLGIESIRKAWTLA